MAKNTGVKSLLSGTFGARKKNQTTLKWGFWGALPDNTQLYSNLFNNKTLITSMRTQKNETSDSPSIYCLEKMVSLYGKSVFMS